MDNNAFDVSMLSGESMEKTAIQRRKESGSGGPNVPHDLVHSTSQAMHINIPVPIQGNPITDFIKSEKERLKNIENIVMQLRGVYDQIGAQIRHHEEIGAAITRSLGMFENAMDAPVGRSY